ncbi:MAG: hypothetical protein LBK04_00580 [Clostridiales Family XIII bacterium]|jgi:hypothetical protein|nr:hypothetical protein [Clostridiales Family XIII bacterium]
MGKFSFDTTVGELLDNPETKALVEELNPELLEHPLLDVGRTFRFEDALPYIEDMVEPEKLEEFKAKLEAM